MITLIPMINSETLLACNKLNHEGDDAHHLGLFTIDLKQIMPIL